MLKEGLIYFKLLFHDTDTYAALCLWDVFAQWKLRRRRHESETVYVGRTDAINQMAEQLA
jgi:hypothetical protein